MAMSHANCTHPATSSARAACRKAGGPQATPGAVEPVQTRTTSVTPLPNPQRKGAKRAAQVKATIEPRVNIPAAKDCAECGGKAAFTQWGRSVCYTHCDQSDNYVILPL